MSNINNSTVSSLTSVGTLSSLRISDASSCAWKFTNAGTVSTLLSRNHTDTAYTTALYDAIQHVFYISGAEAFRAIAGGNVGFGTNSPGFKVDVVGDININSGSEYKINSIDVLSATTLGSSVVNSSLTSVGTLTGLNCSGLTIMPPATQTVANAATIQLSTTVSNNILRPTSDTTIAGAVLNFPGSPSDGQVCTIVTTATITAVTGSLNTASLPAVTTLLVGTYLNCVWNATAAKWIVGK